MTTQENTEISEAKPEFSFKSSIKTCFIPTVIVITGLYFIIQLILELGAIYIVWMVVYFFRKPNRKASPIEGNVYSPVDGKVVAIERVFEDEYLKEERIQVSVFMSPFNVHINWAPISGIVKYFKYHPGKFLVAWHPKSSTLNERTTYVVENKNGVNLQRYFNKINDVCRQYLY